MLLYTVRRLLLIVPTLFGVMLIVFFITYQLGNPALLLAPLEASREEVLAIEERLGLDQPLPVQFGRYLQRILVGDFGTSYYNDEPALDLVLQRLPATVNLGLAAIAIALAAGLPGGVLGALGRGRSSDLLVSAIVLFGMSIPNFWLGLVLIIVFAVELSWLPVSGTGTAAHLVLPAMTIATGMSATVARIVRNDLIDVLNSDFVRTAVAKGADTFRVVFRHALRNSLGPTVTLLGLQIGGLLGGAVVTETIFAWPGVGRLILQSIERRDFPVVQAAVFFLALVFILTNLVVDLVTAWLDPRISYV